jgi:hypothetical protein
MIDENSDEAVAEHAIMAWKVGLPATATREEIYAGLVHETRRELADLFEMPRNAAFKDMIPDVNARTQTPEDRDSVRACIDNILDEGPRRRGREIGG